MLVVEVLNEAGWPLGDRGRTRCPVHQGKNRQSFSYKEELWSCFACGEAGNAWQLLKILMPERCSKPVDYGRVEGLPAPDPRPSDVTLGFTRLSPAERLRRSTLEYAEALLDRLTGEHQWGSELVRMGRAIHHHDPELAMETVCWGLAIEETMTRELDSRWA